MSQAISLFSGYDVRENRTTNYCLLLLKLFYEHNPKYLARVFDTLIGGEVGAYVGVSFTQQQRRETSVPDGLIRQSAFAIYIETKQFDWFYDDQLERHLTELQEESSGAKVLLALSNFEANERARFQRIRRLCNRKFPQIFFAARTFEEFWEALHPPDLPIFLQTAVADFGAYLNEENLLPTWQRHLDVVSCAQRAEEIEKGSVYMCPAEGGSYNHRRCKYFGLYRDKKVDKIALIRAVIEIRDSRSAEVRWCNVEAPESEVIKLAKEKMRRWRRNEFPLRVFLLGRLYDTSFAKDSPGGMYGSKRYFDVYRLRATDEADLANKLRNYSWSQLRSEDA